jgi:uncharacterized membrane protein YgcG
MKWMIAIVVALVWQQPHAHPPRVTDAAKMFSPAAVTKGAASLDELARATGWDVAIKTVDSLDGKPIRDAAFDGVKATDIHGLFLLFSKGDKKFYAASSPDAAQAFSDGGIKGIDAAITSAFKAGRFDDGLDAAVGQIRTLAAATPVSDAPVGVHDRARMFSTDALIRADDALRSFERESKWQVAVATIDALNGQDIRARAVKDATSSKVHGLFVLISKADHKIEIVPSRSAEGMFTKEKIGGIVDTLRSDFKAGKYDQGLQDAVAAIRRVVPAATAVATIPPIVPRTPTPPPTTPVLESSATPRADEPVKAAPVSSNPMLMYVGIGVGALVLLWILSRAFGSSRRAAYPAGNAPAQPQRPWPTPGFAPSPSPAPGPPPGYGPPRPSAPPVGYGQPGYGGQQPGYGPVGYGPPPQQGGGGGGFLSGALGGLGGAIAGNILYDQFGRPHQGGNVGGHVEGHVPPPGGYGGQVPYNPPPGQVGAPGETYDPNAGAGGSWDTPDAASPAPAGEWEGTGDAGQPTGGDWGQPEPHAAQNGGDWGAPAPDQGGDWGAAPPDQTSEPDWPAPTPDDPGASAGPDPDQGQGGSW